MNTNNSFNNIVSNNKNFAALYSLAANSVSQQYSNTHQKVREEQEQTLINQPPQFSDLNITPYTPKIVNPQNFKNQQNAAKEQIQQNQESQNSNKRVNTNEMKAHTAPQDQQYNFNYMQMINQQANNASLQNNSQLSTQQFTQQMNKNSSQFIQLDNNNQNTNSEETIQSSRTPAFIFSNQNLQSPKQSFYTAKEINKNLSQYLSPISTIDNGSNKQSSINLQSNNQFDLNQSEAKVRSLNEQLNDQDLLSNNQLTPLSYQNQISQNNTSLQSVPISYYQKQSTPNYYTNPKEIIPYSNYSYQLEAQNIGKNNEFNYNISNRPYVQSCTNSPKNQSSQTKSHQKLEKPIKSLNVSLHMEDFQQKQQEVLNEQQKKLNQQLQKIQSLNNSFIQINDHQNDNSNYSNPQTSRVKTNTLMNMQQNSQKKDDFQIFQNFLQTDSQYDIESYLSQMNDIWAKLQVSVKTKLIRQKQQSQEDISLAEHLKSAKESISSLENQLNCKEQTILKQQKENEQLKANIQHLTDKVSYLSENVNGFQSEQNQLLKSLQNKLQEKDNVILNLQLQLKKRAKYELNTSRSERESEVMNLKQLLIQKTDIITELKIKNQMLREELIQQGQYQVQKENNNPEQGQINQKKKEYNLLKQKVNLLEEDIKRFNEEMNQK